MTSLQFLGSANELFHHVNERLHLASRPLSSRKSRPTCSGPGAPPANQSVACTWLLNLERSCDKFTLPSLFLSHLGRSVPMRSTAARSFTSLFLPLYYYYALFVNVASSVLNSRLRSHFCACLTCCDLALFTGCLNARVMCSRPDKI